LIFPERGIYGRVSKTMASLSLLMALSINSYLHLKVKDPVHHGSYCYVLLMLVFGKLIMCFMAYYNWSLFPNYVDYIVPGSSEGGLCSLFGFCGWQGQKTTRKGSSDSPSAIKKKVHFTDSTKGGPGMAGRSYEAEWKKYK